jgi:hypothetical protein
LFVKQAVGYAEHPFLGAVGSQIHAHADTMKQTGLSVKASKVESRDKPGFMKGIAGVPRSGSDVR